MTFSFPASSSHQATLDYGYGRQSYERKVHVGLRREATFHTLFHQCKMEKKEKRFMFGSLFLHLVEWLLLLIQVSQPFRANH